jgi:hypothetical protein
LAIARIPTLLSLDRYAQIMQINPAHFNSAIGGATYMPLRNSCANLWWQEDWQTADQVGRESLAQAISDAEHDIARELGWWPAPTWTAQDLLSYPRHYRPDVWRYGMTDVRGAGVGLKATYGKIISPGQRAVTLLGTPTTVAGLAYSDEDGDGFSETATVTLATTLTDVREVKVYFEGQGGAREWEIRPPRTATIAAGVYTATFWVWQFILPALWAFIPTVEGEAGIDVTDANNLVREVDVYREYNDTSAASATFFWEPAPRDGLLNALNSACCSCGGVGCVACQLTTQDGCLHVRNGELGLVVPTPAEYDSDEGAWTTQVAACNRDPDQVSIYYYSGFYDNRWLDGSSNQPLSHYWAQTIAWLATARLERGPCDCNNVIRLFDELREDAALSTSARNYNLPFGVLANPFGTKLGEIRAWMRVKSDRGRLLSRVALV